MTTIVQFIKASLTNAVQDSTTMSLQSLTNETAEFIYNCAHQPAAYFFKEAFPYLTDFLPIRGIVDIVGKFLDSECKHDILLEIYMFTVLQLDSAENACLPQGTEDDNDDDDAVEIREKFWMQLAFDLVSKFPGNAFFRSFCTNRSAMVPLRDPYCNRCAYQCRCSYPLNDLWRPPSYHPIRRYLNLT